LSCGSSVFRGVVEPILGEALDHNPTRERAKDDCAHEQDRADHTEPAQDVSHHVTNYQRPHLTERSLDLIGSK
jgi:hypothetical protein